MLFMSLQNNGKTMFTVHDYSVTDVHGFSDLNPDDGWAVKGYRHVKKGTPEHTDDYLAYMRSYKSACSEDPSLETRRSNAEIKRGFQERCLRDPKYAHLLDAHPRYSYEGPHREIGMAPGDHRFHAQELLLMPDLVPESIHNDPAVVYKDKEVRQFKRKLPRKPKMGKSFLARDRAHILEDRADDGDLRQIVDHADLITSLRKFRAEKKLTQRALSSALNCKLSELRNIERGKLIPSSAFLRAWDDLMARPEFQSFLIPTDEYVEESPLIDDEEIDQVQEFEN